MPEGLVMVNLATLQIIMQLVLILQLKDSELT